MAVEAVVGGLPATASVNAGQYRSVTLGQMTSGQLATVWAGMSAAAAPLGGTMATGSTATDVGALGDRTQVPEVLKAYGNGRIPRDMLTLIGIGQHRLWGPAAEAFKRMRAAAAADGIDLSVTDSYRSYDQQVQLAQQKGLTKNGGWAAVPGTSEHGWGLAVDVDVAPAGLAWLKANGARFGYVMPATREPWHWEYHGQT